MDLLSGIIILVLFVVLVLAIEKIDEKAEEEFKRLDSEFKELQKQYNELVVRLNCENKN